MMQTGYAAPPWFQYGQQVCVTMYTISAIRAWLRKVAGEESELVIEREGERNRVFLRFSLEGVKAECEVGLLIALKKRRLANAQLAIALRELCQ